jgi:serine/threonine protein kinase
MSLPLCSSCGISDGEALSGLCAACLLRAGTAVAVDPAGDPFGPGSTIGPYEIVSTLGRGGMGHVYLAWDSRLCRTVAIKVLPAPFTADGDRTRRLEREARLVAGLNHPRICAVHDLGSDNGRTYVVMEHLQGETLADRLTRGALPLAEALTLACEIADGLDRAHQHGITHRDLKPANIMLTQSGAKLLDFGLAARTYVPDSGLSALSANHWSVIGGTLQYMAPEQLAGKAADARSDVFAFGLVLYEMLTGQPAFADVNGGRLVAAAAAGDPALASALRPEVPPALDRIIRRCLRKDPEQRWQSLRDVIFALTSLADDGAHHVEAEPASAARPVRTAWT